jgi:hypothetical protein
MGIYSLVEAGNLGAIVMAKPATSKRGEELAIQVHDLQ